MNRLEAKAKISELIGKDLRPLAKELGVTVKKENSKINKGWAGQTIELYLGLSLNSSQSPDFDSWELKLCSLKYLNSGQLTIKETMAVTMIDPDNVKNTPFENSHLLNKMRKILIPARIWERKQEERSILHSVTEFDLGNSDIFNQIKADYELVRNVIIQQGFTNLSGSLGVYIQPRTKGSGHGSISRAFYVRKELLKLIIKL